MTSTSSAWQSAPRSTQSMSTPHSRCRARSSDWWAYGTGTGKANGSSRGLLSLTAVENLADACLAAIDWPSGAYNIADAQPYWRDHAIRDVLAAHGIRVRVVHLPVWTVTTIAQTAQLFTANPAFTPYSIAQFSRGFVLDISKAVGQGWRPRRTLTDYLTGEWKQMSPHDFESNTAVGTAGPWRR